jgi:sortase A
MTNSALLKASAVVSALSGTIILFTTIYPIVSYESTAGKRYPTLINPVVEQGSNQTTTYNPSSQSVDYTKPQNWFIGAKYNVGTNPSKVSFYTISIPKFGIEDATVQVGGDDLGKSLVQYPGTANPGKMGNAVVFGHSILPQFFNPKNYMSIFSLLPTMEIGDEITVKYDGAFYKYKVQNMFEVLPTDIQVLEQPSDSPYLSLITCVPPGHPLKPKRLIVRAKLVTPGEIK